MYRDILAMCQQFTSSLSRDYRAVVLIVPLNIRLHYTDALDVNALEGKRLVTM
jgi:hypothetical protein